MLGSGSGTSAETGTSAGISGSEAAAAPAASDRRAGWARSRVHAVPRPGAATLAALLAVAVFGALCLYHYRLPGLYYDEAFDVVPAMQLLHGEPVQLARGVGIHLFGRAFPVMIGDYWGTVSTYAVLPLFWLLGVGVLPVRLWPIGAGMLAVLLTYVLGRRLYDSTTGVAAAALLAVFPSFIFWSRVGIYVISHIVAITLGCVLSWLIWREGRRRRWLFLAALLAGLGLTTKLLFLWFLIAIPAAYVALLAADWLAGARLGGIARRPLPPALWARLRADVPASSIYDPVAAGAGFLLGAFPVIYYNLLSRGSYLVLRANLTQTDRGVNNFALWQNAKVEADAVRVLLDGGYFWFYGGIYTNPLWPPLAALSAAGLLLLVHAVPELRRYRRPTVFLLAFSALIFLLSCFTVSILGPTHLLILLPIPQLTVAAFAILGGRWLAGRLRRSPLGALAYAAAALLLLALVVGDLVVDRQYHRALARSGGYTNFSSAIYTLADQLERERAYRPYALDWGFKYNLEILTDGRVQPREIYGATYEPGPDFTAAVQQALRDPNAVFIAHVEGSESFPRLDAFRRIVAESGRQLVLVREDKELSGRPAYYEFRVR